ncbi:MAG: hypothetical protein DRO36_06795 [Candidatus Hecatellales archaeon]|nr:MAG: hypothetical protein DRO36_06795 [Candidatus Hecatellales archaeon]
MAGSLEIYLARIPAVSLSPALLPAADSASDPNSALFGIIREQEAVWIIVSAFASRRIITENLIDTSESEKFLPGKPLTRPRHEISPKIKKGIIQGLFEPLMGLHRLKRWLYNEAVSA